MGDLASATLSIVIPAFNEEAYLPATLEHVRAAASKLAQAGAGQAEIVVVDNASTDATAAVAASYQTLVVSEALHNVGHVGNVGAQASRGQVLVFLDADTLLPPRALVRIAQTMRDPGCVGGAVDLLYRPRRRVVRWYLAAWRLVGKLARVAMGSGQFCRRDVFSDLGGYDATIFMGEDVEFFMRLRRLARRHGLRAPILNDVVVQPSARRMDAWPLWRILLLTNPLFILPLRRRRTVWDGWYTKLVR